MGLNSPSKTPIDHYESVSDADRSAPILSWIKKDIQLLTNLVSDNLQGGITVNLSKDILTPIKDKRWTKDREKGSAYVIFIQRLLNERLGTKLALDSQLGPDTNAALRRFQEKVQRDIGSPYAERVSVDGIIGPATINALLSDDGTYTELKAYFDSNTDDAAPARAAATTPTPTPPPVVNTDSFRAATTPAVAAAADNPPANPPDNPPANPATDVTGTTAREPRQAAQSFQEVLREFNTGELRLTPAQFNSFTGLLVGDSLRDSFSKLDRVTQITISGSGDIETAYKGTPTNPFYYLFFRMTNNEGLFKNLKRIDVHGSVDSLHQISSQTIKPAVDIHFHDVADTTDRVAVERALPTNANVHFHSVVPEFLSDSSSNIDEALREISDGCLVLSNSQINDFINYATIPPNNSVKTSILESIREIEISDESNTFASQSFNDSPMRSFCMLLLVKPMTPNLRKITLNTHIDSYADLGLTADVSSRDTFRGIELVIPNPSDELKQQEIPKLGGMTVTLGE